MTPERTKSLAEVFDLLVGCGVDPVADTPEALTTAYEEAGTKPPEITLSAEALSALLDDDIEAMKTYADKKTQEDAVILDVVTILGLYQTAVPPDSSGTTTTPPPAGSTTTSTTTPAADDESARSSRRR